jgi:hypothetical protein
MKEEQNCRNELLDKKFTRINPETGIGKMASN